MPRSGTLGNPRPYTPFGVFAGLPFWGGGLTLLAAAPGIGKTSWLLRIIFESTCLHIPSAIGCYEHTPEELRFRLFLQTEAMTYGPRAHALKQRLRQPGTESRFSDKQVLYLHCPDYSWEC